MDNEKFAGFSRIDLVYSSIRGRDLQASILTPKKLRLSPPSSRPVLVHWHGGGFIVGHLANRALEFALSRGALIISPDYRLVPEANGTDILADIERFSVWMKNELPSVAHQESWHAFPDLSRVASSGQSAGACNALHSAFLSSPKIDIKVVICISGPLDTSASLKFNIPLPRTIMGTRPPPPRQAEALIRDYIRNIEPGAVRTEGDPADMWPLLICIIQQAWLPRLLGVKSNPQLLLVPRLKHMESMPPLWLIHGEEDSIIPAECSTLFAEAVKARFPEHPMLVSIEHGDHVFSSDMKMNETWIEEGCRFVSDFWA
ncbi:alpha/beta-Hydrolase [Glarea lozoyensis ATCC 20868]|uniref:Alpha/beta-Hydrolase n=1 Tax=Glarea lozoyensis (strain ATCC 20868 / MF5171) TaxID=1116229 RepID=S3CQG6_GLAL2|nr:alpha/beta-Hydrolase [Glarea lozoyensis ATCC 20868]EPE28702.1 alpha/beta-Hydrolase [Glarea lozoyensis ATCC 20868]